MGSSQLIKSLFQMMNPVQKKKIRTLDPKKGLPLPRLIKCYVCNQHFDSQPQFDLHLKQHQNKLNRTAVDEIQRKTQESFNKKKQITPLNKTQLINVPNSEKRLIEVSKEKVMTSTEEPTDDKEEQEIEFALRESQILLQKIEFMTQVVQPQSPSQPQKKQEYELEYIEKTIEGERQLHQLISKAQNSASIEKMILQTKFQSRYFQNYQEQLAHLRLLASVAVSSDSVSKILTIRRNICRDVCADLKSQFESQAERKPLRLKKIENPRVAMNEGQVKFCGQCYSQIGGMEEHYSLQCGHSYHMDCWNGQCCG